MTEAEWLTCGNPFPMLCHLQEGGSLDARKARLFAVACCRRVLSFLPDDKHREAVEVSARFADGQARKADLERVSEELQSFYGEPPGDLAQPSEMIYLLTYWPLAADWMDACTGSEQAIRLASHAHRTGQVLRSQRWFADDEWWEREAESAGMAERTAQADLIRDIFGNPFRPLPHISDTSLAWNDSVVVKMAASIYIDQTSANLPILADALQEAGTSDGELLGHLRGSGPHTKGCWALDLVLQKG